MVIGQDEVKRRLGTKTLYFSTPFRWLSFTGQESLFEQLFAPRFKPAEINSYIMKLTKLKSALLILRTLRNDDLESHRQHRSCRPIADRDR